MIGLVLINTYIKPTVIILTNVWAIKKIRLLI